MARTGEKKQYDQGEKTQGSEREIGYHNMTRRSPGKQGQERVDMFLAVYAHQDECGMSSRYQEGSHTQMPPVIQEGKKFFADPGERANTENGMNQDQCECGSCPDC